MIKTYRMNFYMRFFLIFIVLILVYASYDIGFTFSRIIYLLFVTIVLFNWAFIKVRIDEKGIYQIKIIGANKQIKWEDIEQLNYREHRYIPFYIIIDRYNTKIEVTIMENMGELLNFIFKKATNADVKSRFKKGMEKYQKRNK